MLEKYEKYHEDLNQIYQQYLNDFFLDLYDLKKNFKQISFFIKYEKDISSEYPIVITLKFKEEEAHNTNTLYLVGFNKIDNDDIIETSTISAKHKKLLYKFLKEHDEFATSSFQNALDYYLQTQRVEYKKAARINWGLDHEIENLGLAMEHRTKKTKLKIL